MNPLHWAGRRLLIAGTVVAVAGASLVVSLSTAGATATAKSTQARPAVLSTAIPAAMRGKLDALARETATTSGDARPASVQALATSESTAVTVATPGDSVPDSAGQTVYLVVMTGNFTLSNVPLPPGASAPTGHYLTFTVATGSMAILDLGLSDIAPSAALKHIGSATNLPG